MQACGVLANVGPRADEPLRAEVAKALEQVLTQPLEESKEAPEAARALVKWTTIDNLPVLAEAVWSDNPSIRKSIQETLDRLQAEVDPPTRQAIADAVSRGREVVLSQAIPRALKVAGQGDHTSRLNALRKLAAELVDPKFQAAVVSTMLNLFGESNALIQDNTLAVLAVWARPSDLPAIRTLLDNENLAVRSMAIKYLTKAKDPEAIEKFVAMADERRLDWDVRAALASYGSAAEPALLKVLENGSDLARTAACRLLESVGTQESLQALRAVQETSDGRLRMAARRTTQILERKFGAPADAKPKPKRKPRTRSNAKAGGAPSSARNNSGQGDPR
jgi:HEAT repeat protein